MSKINEKELQEMFADFRKNNKKSFEVLYEKYNSLVYAIAFSILKNKENSEDIKQAVFLKIWKMEKDKLPTRNEASWLYTITKNETLNYLRNIKNEQNIDDLYCIESDNVELNEIIDQDKYNRIIAGLNFKEQEIISLRILSNLSFKEISQILNIPIGTVQWKYYKSLNTLKILLGNISAFIITISLLFANVIKNRNIGQNKNMADNIQESESEEEIFESTKNIENTQSFNESLGIETNELTENVIIQDDENIQITNANIGLISVAVFFLSISIIFLIFFLKHQQKAKRKVSK